MRRQPKSFRSSFSSVYLIPISLHQALMRSMNSIEKEDLNRFNQSAAESASLSGDPDVQSPPVVILDEPLNNSMTEENEKDSSFVDKNPDNLNDVVSGIDTQSSQLDNFVQSNSNPNGFRSKHLGKVS